MHGFCIIVMINDSQHLYGAPRTLGALIWCGSQDFPILTYLILSITAGSGCFYCHQCEMKVVKLEQIILFKITESMCSVRSNIPVLFTQLLGKNLAKNTHIRIKEVMNITWVLDVGDGVLFWKNDGASCMLRWQRWHRDCILFSFLFFSFDLQCLLLGTVLLIY